MISAKIQNWKSIPGLKAHPVWSAAFEWIEENASTAEEGWHDLEIGGAKVRVMSYPTKTREEAKYEAHRETIDIQYTIEGAEGIEFTTTESLTPKEEYKPEKDAQIFETPEVSEGRVDNVPGRFSIFYPEDAHLPQLNVEGYSEVRKLVVKVPLDAVRWEGLKVGRWES